jgi:hypothetical protein
MSADEDGSGNLFILFFVDPFDEACVYEYAVVHHDD